jgi:hypothetical protein
MYNNPYGLRDAKLAIHFFEFLKLRSQEANFREENINCHRGTLEICTE